MWQSLHDAWWRLATTTQPRSFTQHLLSGFLQGGALVYQAGVTLRNRAYDAGWIRQARLPCSVISVGNLTVGGTGKTSCVELLARKIQRLDRRVAVLSRGYSGRLRGPYCVLQRNGRLLVNDRTDAHADGVADEPHLLATHLAEVPILVGARREQTGEQACEEFQAEVVILDDGLQYRRLHRDCEVVLINARMPLGGWPLFPRGPMREPLSSLRRAEVIVITKVDQSLELSAALQERLKAINPTAVMATAVHEPVGLWTWDGTLSQAAALDPLDRSHVSLLSSIGDPDGFEQTVQRLGAIVVSHTTYPDHYRYTPREWQQALAVARASRADALVTTEKDMIRLRHVMGEGDAAALPVWVVQVQMRVVSGEEQLDDRLAAVCRR